MARSRRRNPVSTPPMEAGTLRAKPLCQEFGGPDSPKRERRTPTRYQNRSLRVAGSPPRVHHLAVKLPIFCQSTRRRSLLGRSRMDVRQPRALPDVPRGFDGAAMSIARPHRRDVNHGGPHHHCHFPPRICRARFDRQRLPRIGGQSLDGFRPTTAIGLGQRRGGICVMDARGPGTR